MSQQYKRACTLTLGAASGKQYDVSALRITFRVRHATRQTPKSAEIRVYNLAAGTANEILAEFDRVRLSAGYGEQVDPIFTGTAIQIRRGRESGTTTYLDILATDGEKAYNFSIVNKALSAGATQDDILRAVLEAVKPFGVTLGRTVPLNPRPLPRGVVLTGPVKSILRVFADANGLDWYFEDGRLNLVRAADTAPAGSVIELNRGTGLIGLPEQTINGINVRCLLRPAIRAGTFVRLSNESIQRAPLNPDYAAVNSFPAISRQGLYKVFAVDTLGDTRGQPWYSDLTCVAADGGVGLFNRAYLNAIPS